MLFTDQCELLACPLIVALRHQEPGVGEPHIGGPRVSFEEPAIDIERCVSGITAQHLRFEHHRRFPIRLYRPRRTHFGNTVKVNYLVNLKSGLCPENCNYCSQAVGSEAPILKYSYLSPEEALKQAGAGLKGGATRVCMVSSGRGPSDRDIDKVVEMTEAMKAEYEGVEVCACLGLLKDGQAERLKDAGVDAYNHNINTAESNHDNIVQTHTYDDRIDTIGKAKSAGLSPCSGLIAGLAACFSAPELTRSMLLDLRSTRKTSQVPVKPWVG